MKKDRRNVNLISWLGRRFWNITFTPDEDIDVKEIRELLNDITSNPENQDS